LPAKAVIKTIGFCLQKPSLKNEGSIIVEPLERVKGIEPSYAAWEAAVLPLNYTRFVKLASSAL
jgi:hypothetical protein